MTDKKFLVQSFNKVKSVTTLDQFYEQCKSSMDRHWESTYESNKDILQDKKCVDVGIWLGISNAYALEKFNLQTTHGIDPNKDFIKVCAKLLPNTKFYSTIDEVDETIDTDVLFMLGLIPFFGTQWKEHLNRILQKINANYIILRHQTYDETEGSFTNPKEYNVLGLTDYSTSADVDDVVWFLQNQEWLLTKKQENVYTFKKYGQKTL